MTHIKRQLSFLVLLGSLIIWMAPVFALSPLFDGDFESGTLQGWIPGASGTAIVASRGTCFAGNDTTALSIRGRYAGLLRSVTDIKSEQAASLTSKPFIAGRGLVFLAISELLKDTPKQNPFALNVSILDVAGKVLQTEAIATALADLAGGCPSATGDASFGQHFINTHAYAGKQIKLRFSHHPDLAKEGAFTLVDEVSIVSINETPIFQSFPIAKAGFRFEENHLFLISGLPDGDIDQTQDWQFSWLINGETTRRPYFNPCIDDLEPGDYTANLYVRQNERLVTDTLHFSVPYIIFSRTAIDSNTDDTAGSGTSGSGTATSSPFIISSDDDAVNDGGLVCNVRHPIDLSPDSALLEDAGSIAEDPDAPAPLAEDTERPSISTFVVNSPFVIGEESALISNIDISSEVDIASAFISISSAQVGDELIPPSSGALNGLSLSCSSDTTCTLTGEALNAAYEIALRAFSVTLIDAIETRTLSVNVTDITGQTSITTSALLNVSGATQAPQISILTLSASFKPDEVTDLIDTINITSQNDLASATLALIQAQAGDALVLPPATNVNGLIASCGAPDTQCTITGNGSTGNYESILNAITISLGASTAGRTVRLSLVDSEGLSNSDDGLKSLVIETP